MVLIWLFLLGISEIVNGRFTAVEVVLTVAIGGFSATGIVSGVRAGRSLRWWQAVLVLLAGWLVQLAAMELSYSMF